MVLFEAQMLNVKVMYALYCGCHAIHVILVFDAYPNIMIMKQTSPREIVGPI